MTSSYDISGSVVTDTIHILKHDYIEKDPLGRHGDIGKVSIKEIDAPNYINSTEVVQDRP